MKDKETYGQRIDKANALTDLIVRRYGVRGTAGPKDKELMATFKNNRERARKFSMKWYVQEIKSSGWDRARYVKDVTTERIGTFAVRKYTFERKADKKTGKGGAFAEGHTRVAKNWAMMYLSTLSGL